MAKGGHGPGAIFAVAFFFLAICNGAMLIANAAVYGSASSDAINACGRLADLILAACILYAVQGSCMFLAALGDVTSCQNTFGPPLMWHFVTASGIIGFGLVAVGIADAFYLSTGSNCKNSSQSLWSMCVVDCVLGLLNIIPAVGAMIDCGTR